MAADRELRLIVPEKLLQDLKRALEVRMAFGEAIGIVDQFAALVIHSMLDDLSEKRITGPRYERSSSGEGSR
jgi:hypothetical protein